MSTMTKWLKAEIARSNKKLLLAAVVLFCLSLSIVSPVKGIEGLIAANLTADSKTTEKKETQLPQPSFLFANTLASLTNSSGDEPVVESAGLSTLQNSALIVKTNPVTFISQEARTGIITYTVQEGDTLSSIAASFGISLSTLLWANNLKETGLIRPGDDLIVPPVTGVIHKVKDGQTVGWIANYYKASEEEVIAFNDLPADGTIQIGQKLVVPDGQMPTPTYSAPSRVAQTNTTGPGTGKSHIFPYGQCTWYVAQKRYVPWSGHAKSWLANARAYGFQTGSAPQVGSIIATNESWYGHVGYVESINGSWITFSEMNHLGWGVKSIRTLHVNDWKIRGYIY